VTLAHGEVEGKLRYDYLIFALGRRLATEQISGFFEHAHHLLDVDAAIQFGKEIANFHEGRVVIGHCEGARLPVPVYEAAFALAALLDESGERDRVRITLVTPTDLGSELGDQAGAILDKALASHGIEVLDNFPIKRLTQSSASTESGDTINFDLLMLIPPFRGSSAAAYMGIGGPSRYISVDWTMRVIGHKGIYAVGDCVDFDGPKLGHMAVRQAEVAAANVAAEIEGHEPVSHYSHELRLVIDQPGDQSLYVHKDIWTDEPGTVREGRFWSWAKRAQQKFWELSHS
jgi:sulfide:quinone oxidoreductase